MCRYLCSIGEFHMLVVNLWPVIPKKCQNVNTSFELYDLSIKSERISCC